MPAFPFNEFNYLSIQWIYWPDVWASIELSHLLVDFIYVVCTVHWYTLDVKVMQKILECFWYSSHTLNDRRWGKIKPSIFAHNTSEWRSKWIERWALQSPKCLIVWVFARLISICRFRQTLQWHECLSVCGITSLAIHRLTIWLFIFFFFHSSSVVAPIAISTQTGWHTSFDDNCKCLFHTAYIIIRHFYVNNTVCSLFIPENQWANSTNRQQYIYSLHCTIFPIQSSIQSKSLCVKRTHTYSIDSFICAMTLHLLSMNHEFVDVYPIRTQNISELD